MTVGFIGLVRCGTIFLQKVTVFSKIVFVLILCTRTIFDGFGRTVSDAGHAVGALIAPDRLFALQGNVV